MDYPRTIEINVSQDIILSHIEHLLRNWGYVTKSEDIANTDKVITLSLTLVKKEVEETVDNSTETNG